MSAEPEVIARLRAVLAREDLVNLAVLFGSRAAGRAAANSDYDIGIVPRTDLTSKQESALADDLSGVTGTEIDLVRLDVVAATAVPSSSSVNRHLGWGESLTIRFWAEK